MARQLLYTVEFIFVVFLIVAPAAYAQSALEEAAKAVEKTAKAIAPVTTDDKTKEATIDGTVPKSPAFISLGVTPENVIRPVSPRAFASSILTGADPRGHLQTGLAVETAPYLVYTGNAITLKQYQDEYAIRLLSRTQLSLATAKANDTDDKATRLALGFLITPFDRGDPRTDRKLLDCFTQRVGAVHADATKVMDEVAPIAATRPQDVPAALAKRLPGLEQRAKDQAESCRQEARKRNWNASAWNIGLAPTWVSPKGSTSDLRPSGTSVWTSAGYGFEGLPGLEDNAQIIAHARYRPNERVPAPEGNNAFIKQDTLTLAGQIRLAGFSFRKTTGGPDLNFLLEAAYVNEARQHRRDEKIFRYTGGFDYKITDDLYLDVSIGSEDGRKSGRNGRFGGVALKWAFSDKPTRNVK